MFERYKSIVILTGAGISVASGLKTYRGPGGIYENGSQSSLTVKNLQEQPEVIWSIFNEMREAIEKAQPNAAHIALAELEKDSGAKRTVTVITQNVDGLHQLAGTTSVIELHGNVSVSRCTNKECSLEPFHDNKPHLGEALCPRCSSLLRPNVVLFDEAIGGKEEYRAKRALRDVDLFIAVGTSGLVSPASNFLRSANYVGAKTIYVNVEALPEDFTGFQRQCIGKAEEILPSLLQQKN